MFWVLAPPNSKAENRDKFAEDPTLQPFLLLTSIYSKNFSEWFSMHEKLPWVLLGWECPVRHSFVHLLDFRY